MFTDQKAAHFCAVQHLSGDGRQPDGAQHGMGLGNPHMPGILNYFDASKLKEEIQMRTTRSILGGWLKITAKVGPPSRLPFHENPVALLNSLLEPHYKRITGAPKQVLICQSLLSS